jgi:enamine deaminase RidA (YjgF/YER057c/UK114 family)
MQESLAFRGSPFCSRITLVADAASDLLEDVFGRDKNPSRLVYGVASLPFGTPVELEIIFELVG